MSRLAVAPPWKRSSAKLLSSALFPSPAAPGLIQVDIAFVDQTSFGELLISLNQGTQVVLMRAGKPNAGFIVSLGPALLAAELSPGLDRERMIHEWETRIAGATGRVLEAADGGAVTVQARHADRFAALEHAPMYEIGVLIAAEVGPAAKGEWTSGLLGLFYPTRWISSAQSVELGQAAWSWHEFRPGTKRESVRSAS